MNFAFYGRVSTEDQQDPEASKGWQLARARSLIEPHGGQVVVKFFDEGQSRSLPWSRRPQASGLLAALKDPARGFDAVVIGEPARAFSGAQFALTFPVLEHYGVDLWVPEVGGRVDPGSEAHDLVMNLFGGMSKGERQRIKTRVRAAMSDQAAREGRFLGGRPPYGYRLVAAGRHPNPAKAAVGQQMHRLEVDPIAAPIVRRIFAEYLGGAGIYAIAEGLTRDAIPCPSAYDRARNRHRDGRAWGKSAVRAILKNPRYTGRQVWNRQRRDEVLVDVEDVAAGYESTMRWNDRADWIWSSEPTHEALVSSEDFARVTEQMSAGRNRPATRKPHKAREPYVLRGLITCGLCGRRMAGHHTRAETRHRCRYPAEYALAHEVDHPRSVLVREDLIVDALDAWLTRLFEPGRIEETIAQLVEVAGAGNDGNAARGEAAQRLIVDCDERLSRYRSALEHGADPEVVTVWIREVQGDRLRAQRAALEARSGPAITADVVRAVLAEVGDLRPALSEADPLLKREVYTNLGIEMTYRPGDDVVGVSAQPVGLSACRRGDLNSHRSRPGPSAQSTRSCVRAGFEPQGFRSMLRNPGQSGVVRDSRVIRVRRSQGATVGPCSRRRPVDPPSRVATSTATVAFPLDGQLAPCARRVRRHTAAGLR